MTEVPLPDDLKAQAEERRQELVEAVADADDAVADLFLAEEDVPGSVLHAAIRRATVARSFFPVFMGSAYRNVGVQLLLDGVSDFLPSPTDVRSRPTSPSPRRPRPRCPSFWVVAERASLSDAQNSCIPALCTQHAYTRGLCLWEDTAEVSFPSALGGPCDGALLPLVVMQAHVNVGPSAAPSAGTRCMGHTDALLPT